MTNQSHHTEALEAIEVLTNWRDQTPVYDGGDARALFYRRNLRVLNTALAALSTPAASAQWDATGYINVFYEIAKVLGIPARADSPANVWRNEMRPKLIAALAKAGQTT